MSFWQMAYAQHWATLDQIKQAAAYDLISPTDYKTITGTDYTAPATT